MQCDRQGAVVKTITSRLHVIHVLLQFDDVGLTMSEATYFREKKTVEEMKLEKTSAYCYVLLRPTFGIGEKMIRDHYQLEKEPTRKSISLQKTDTSN